MIRFECDYGEGAHPQIMERLAATNFCQTPGYGEDEFCGRAREYIKRECGRADVDVHFLVGGTQTNMTVIAAALRPWQGAVAADSGHINVHETGAIEATGHKVLAVAGKNGKITADQVAAAISGHWNDENHEHMVQPGLVYISFPTESGTLYTKAELSAIYEVCKENQVYLFIDGARLGYGLMAPGNDVTMADLARLCDVFYIGGTKVGALFGEAVVIINEGLKKDFRYIMKQRGGMLAKGRLLGIQFETLFEKNLYYDISRHAIEMAMAIRDAFRSAGIPFLFESSTNQQFPVLNDAQMAALSEKYAYSFWERTPDGRSGVRFCTSWATTQEQVAQLVKDIAALKAFM